MDQLFKFQITEILITIFFLFLLCINSIVLKHYLRKQNMIFFFFKQGKRSMGQLIETQSRENTGKQMTNMGDGAKDQQNWNPPATSSAVCLGRSQCRRENFFSEIKYKCNTNFSSNNTWEQNNKHFFNAGQCFKTKKKKKVNIISDCMYGQSMTIYLTGSKNT